MSNLYFKLYFCKVLLSYRSQTGCRKWLLLASCVFFLIPKRITISTPKKFVNIIKKSKRSNSSENSFFDQRRKSWVLLLSESSFKLYGIQKVVSCFIIFYYAVHSIQLEKKSINLTHKYCSNEIISCFSNIKDYFYSCYQKLSTIYYFPN